MLSEFAKEKVFWTRKMNLKLVKFMESRPNIWNPKHPKYTSVEYRDQTYADFACKYGNEFTGQAVKDRWTNIRSTFANYLRKVKASQSKGGQVYKVTWHLWDACRFLLKVNKNSHTENVCRDNEILDEKDKEDLSSEENVSEKSSNETVDAECQNIANGILNVFRSVQNDVFGLDNTKYGQLGKVISSKLSTMSSYDGALLSNKIMEILLLYDENNPLNPNNVKAECQ